MILHIARSVELKKQALNGVDVFVILRLLRKDGSIIVEYASDLWRVREEVAWGAFWTVSLPADGAAVWFGLYRSNLFTEPLIGCCEFEVPEAAGSDVRWHPLFPEESDASSNMKMGGSSQICGEVLLSMRKYSDNVSVSPIELGYDSDDSLEEPMSSLPPVHTVSPISPIAECSCTVRTSR